MARFLCKWAISFAGLLAPTICLAAGPDVIVGFVDDAREFSRVGTKIGLTASTNSCNIGDAPLNWLALSPPAPAPGSSKHPAITLNFYRLMDGRMEQLAKSWIKHGFFATNQGQCAHIPEMGNRVCQPGVGGTQLRPGCSDYYSEDLNSDPERLGPRSRIANAATVEFDAATAQDLTGYPPSKDAERVLLVEEADLQQATARYFLEAHYLTADDAAAGNARNNVTYREVKPVLRSGAWALVFQTDNIRMQPAITAWKDAGALLGEIETLEGGAKTYLMIGSKASPAPGGKVRYDYTVYNMNSDLAVQSFSVPASGVDAASVGFKAVASNGEIWSNDPWESKIDAGAVTWSTKTYDQDKNANAIRWGSTYTFWFVASGAPGKAVGTVSRFKPASGGISPTASTAIVAPARN